MASDLDPAAELLVPGLPALLEHIDQAIIVQDSSGCIQLLNAAARLLFPDLDIGESSTVLASHLSLTLAVTGSADGCGGLEVVGKPGWSPQPAVAVPPMRAQRHWLTRTTSCWQPVVS